LVAAAQDGSKLVTYDFLAEISSHLSERIAELRAHGEPHPTEQAISSLGDPAELACQFVTEARTSHGIHSYAPWTLLRRAARAARSGTRGFSIFSIALFGYGFAVAGLIAAAMKPFVPGMGLWVSRFGMVWGVPSDGAAGHELLGRYFIPASILLLFVFASSTTLLLRRLTKNISFFGRWSAEWPGKAAETMR
jgi:HAAS domain-containing protein